jgi:hypothetical protein
MRPSADGLAAQGQRSLASYLSLFPHADSATFGPRPAVATTQYTGAACDLAGGHCRGLVQGQTPLPTQGVAGPLHGLPASESRVGRASRSKHHCRSLRIGAPIAHIWNCMRARLRRDSDNRFNEGLPSVAKRGAEIFGSSAIRPRLQSREPVGGSSAAVVVELTRPDTADPPTIDQSLNVSGTAVRDGDPPSAIFSKNRKCSEKLRVGLELVPKSLVQPGAQPQRPASAGAARRVGTRARCARPRDRGFGARASDHQRPLRLAVRSPGWSPRTLRDWITSRGGGSAATTRR